MSQTIIRDYAYPQDDPRFSGKHEEKPVVKEVEQAEQEPETQDREEEEEEEDPKDWEWTWGFKPLASTVIPNTSAHIDTTLCERLPTLGFQKSWIFYRAVTIFPFTRASECEMSLETGEQLIVLGEKQDSKTPGERWSSIDEMETATDSQELQFVVEPNDLPKHVESFLEFSAKYGSSWVLALKLRVYGSKTQIKVMLRDLGLVPANYVEKASIQ